MMRFAGQQTTACSDAASAPACACARAAQFVPASGIAVWAVSFFVFLRLFPLCPGHIRMTALLFVPILPGVLPVFKKFISRQRE